MALKPQVVPIIVDEGLNNIIDDKALAAGQFKRLENVRRKKNGRFEKRYGSVSLSRDVNGESDLSSTQGLAAFGNELLQFSGNKAYSYAENLDRWFPKGDVALLSGSVSQVFRNSEQQVMADGAYNATLGIVGAAWEDSRGGVRAKIYDANSDAVLVADASLNTSAIRPKVIASGIYIFVFYVVASTLRVRRYDRNVGTSFDAEVSLAADVNATTQFFDAAVYNADIVITWHTTGNQIKLAYITPTPAVGNPVSGYPAAATLAFAVTDSLAIWSQVDAGLIYLAWFDSAVGLRVTARKAVDLSQQYAPVTVDSTLSPVVRNICGISTASTSSRLFYEVSGQKVNTNTISSTGTIGTNTLLRRGVGIASKPFVCDSQVFLMTSWDSTLQSSYFAIRSDGFIVGKFLYGRAGGNSLRASFCPEVTSTGSETFLINGLQKNKIITELNTTFTRTGVIDMRLDCSGDRQPRIYSLGENMHLLGGVVQSYDGVSFTETGFHIFPEGLTNPSNSNVGGTLTDGVRQYAVLYEWTDARGQIHRSAPSVPFTVTLSGGTATQTTTLAIPTLRLTAKQGERIQPVLAVFRTENAGSIFYRVSSQTIAGGNNGLFLSDSTVDSVSFTDALADSLITSGEILYTTGGILENIAPDACDAGIVFKNRLIINSSDNSGVSYYSKEAVPGEGLAFSPFLSIDADPENQPVKSFGVLDDKLILFKESQTYGTYGDGLNDAGLGNDFAIPERIATGTGCPYPDSVALTQFGLIFKSKRGIRFLDRGLNEVEVDQVQDYENLTIVSAITLPEQDETRFVTEEGTTLVFNSNFKVWTTFTGQPAYDAILWKGQFVYVNTDATVRKEDTTRFDDSGAFVSMYIETGWMSLAGIQGFQRIWRLLLLGDYRSAHLLSVQIAKDFEPAWCESFYYNPATGVNQTTYGQMSPYGIESPMGGGVTTGTPDALNSVYQIRAHLATQKCESIKFAISDVNTGTAGESFALNAMSFEVGVKEGAFKASRGKGAGSLG